jgi:hypothetical protein
VSLQTLRKWLSPVQIEEMSKKKIFTPKEVAQIFEHLGEP